MNIFDWILILVLAFAIFCSLRKIRKNKGGCDCGCGCSGCTKENCEKNGTISPEVHKTDT